MSKDKENKKDVEFIISEIFRFFNMTTEKRIRYFKDHKFDALSMLPHPGGRGHLVCGYDAYQRFFTLGRRFLSSQKEKKLNIYLPEYIKALQTELVHRFLRDNKPIDRKNIARMLSSAYNYVSENFEPLTHYVPCSIVSSNKPAEFDVGPVRFVHKSRFRELYDEEIESHREKIAKEHAERCKEATARGMPQDRVATIEDSRQLANHLVDSLIDFYRKYDWIGIVQIGNCSSTISRRRALLAVEGALNILKLLLSGTYSDRVRIAYNLGLPLNTAELTRSSDNSLHISLGKTFEGQQIGPEWFNFISEEGGSFFDLAGRTLEAYVDPMRQMPLSQRFLDAIKWYGDAVGENSAAGKVVKYVSAIERMTVTGKEHDKDGNLRSVMKIVVRRSSILCHIGWGNKFDYWEREIGKIYECRSDLLHGSLPPLDNSVLSMANFAESLSRSVLLAGLNYFDALGIDDPKFGVKKLREAFLRLEERYT